MLGWIIFKPIYGLWALELAYLLMTMWVCLSLMYWAHVDRMTKHEFLSILHWSYHPPPRKQVR